MVDETNLTSTRRHFTSLYLRYGRWLEQCCRYHSLGHSHDLLQPLPSCIPTSYVGYKAQLHKYAYVFIQWCVCVCVYPFRYEVNFQKGMGCGGAYMKLLSDNDSLKLVSELHYSTCTCPLLFCRSISHAHTAPIHTLVAPQN